MTILTLIICISAIILAGITLACVYDSENVFKLAVQAVGAFFMTYVITSGILFWLDFFSIILCSSLVLLISIILFIVTFFVFHRRPSINFEWISYIIPVIFTLIMILMFVKEFQFFGMAQDQGVYQVKALMLIEGQNDNTYDIDEYYLLESDEEKAQYKEKFTELLGYYVYADDVTADEVAADDVAADDVTADDAAANINPNTEMQGVFHGSNTYAALLALHGYIWGYNHMNGVNAILAIVCMWVVYMICMNLRLGKAVGILCTGIVTLSPAIVWTAKSSLSESGLMLMVLLYIYYLTYAGVDRRTDAHADRRIDAGADRRTDAHADRRDEMYESGGESRRIKRSETRGIKRIDSKVTENITIILSALPLTAFAFYHISIYTVICAFVLIYIYLYLYRGNIRYVYAGIIAVVSYLAGSVFMLTVFTHYTEFNFYPLARFGIETSQAMPFTLIYGGAMLVVLVMLAILRRIRSKIYDKAMFFSTNSSIHSAGYWAIRMVVVVAGIFIIYRTRGNTLGYLTYYNYIALSGFLMIPLYMINVMVNPGYVTKRWNLSVIGILFAYCILLYSIMFKVTVPYHYYYDRYLVPYIPIAVIAGGIIISKCRLKTYTRKMIVSLLMLVCVAAIYARIDYFIATKQDLTRMEWDTLTEMTSQVDSDDTVIIDDNMLGVYYFPMKTISGVKAYPTMDTLENTIPIAQRNSQTVYYLTKEVQESTETIEFEYVHSAAFCEQMYTNAMERELLPYPLVVYGDEQKVYLYKVTYIDDGVLDEEIDVAPLE